MSKYKRKCAVKDHVVPSKYLVKIRDILVCLDCIRAKTNRELFDWVNKIWNALPSSKVCPKCQDKKPAKEFGVRRSYRYFHLRSYCRICQKKSNEEWCQRNKAKRAEYMREYRKRRR